MVALVVILVILVAAGLVGRWSPATSIDFSQLEAKAGTAGGTQMPLLSAPAA
jgi:hypothetical protein